MITEEMLLEIEGFAELPLGNPELAILMDLPVEDIRVALEDPTNTLGQAIHRGRLRSKAELFRAITQLAKQGSSPAQILLTTYWNHLEP